MPIKLVLGEDHEEAGRVIILHRKPRDVTVYGPDGMEFVTIEWDANYDLWAVREGTLEPIPDGGLHLAETLGEALEAFSVFRAWLRGMYPFKRVAFKASVAGLR